MEQFQEKLNQAVLPDYDARKPGSKSSKRMGNPMDKEMDKFN